MKIINIVVLSVILFSFGLAQQKPAQLNKKLETYDKKKDKKVNSDTKNKNSFKKTNEFSETNNSNVIDLQKSNLKIDPVKVENSHSNKNQKNKQFGSAEKSGHEEKLVKGTNQNAISREELKNKLKNPKKIKKKR